MSAIDSIKSSAFLKALSNEGKVYAVGGCVRDVFLNKETKDIDLIVTGIPIKNLVTLLKQHGHANLVGKSFGVIKFNTEELPDFEIDIALPRKEVSTGQGHKDFDVDFDENLPVEEDLARRDFTINAIAIDLSTGNHIDPFKGIDDIKNKLIRTVFDRSFEEDPLRLLRAIQFAARFEFNLEETTRTQLIENAELIKTISPERIIQEVKKLFMAEKPSFGFDLMHDTGLLIHVFPDVEECRGVKQPNKGNEDVYSHTMKVLDASRSAVELDKPGDLHIMFAALFHDMGKPKTHRENEDGRVTFYNHQHISTGIAWRWMKEHKISTIGVDPREVCHLVKNHMFETKPFEDNDKALRRFINKVGKDHILDLLDLRLADKKGGRFPKKVYGILQLRERIVEEINRKAPFTTKELALKGSDIVHLGFSPGPIIGIIQRHLLEKVLDEPELNTKEQLSEIVLAEKDQFV